MAVAQQAVLDVLGVAAGLLYLLVASTLRRREVSPEHKGAMRGFILWWGGLGLISVVAVVRRRIDLGALSPQVFAVYYTLVMALLLAILAGLVYYLLILYTGDRRWLRRVIAFYGVFAVIMAVFVGIQDPYVGTDPAAPGSPAEVQFAEELPSIHWLRILVLGMLLLPPLVAAGAFLLLYFRVHDRVARYRIVMVAGGIALWFGYSAFGSAVRLAADVAQQGFAGRLIGQVLGVLSATLVLLAYRPPRSVRLRLESPRHASGKDARPTQQPRRQARPSVACSLAVAA